MATKDDPHPEAGKPHVTPPNPPNPPGRGTGSDQPRISRCRVVEFTDMRGHVWPAIVLAVKDDGVVDLMLLTNRGATPDFDIPQSKVPAGEEKAHGRWSWPPRS